MNNEVRNYSVRSKNGRFAVYLRDETATGGFRYFKLYEDRFEAEIAGAAVAAYIEKQEGTR